MSREQPSLVKHDVLIGLDRIYLMIHFISWDASVRAKQLVCFSKINLERIFTVSKTH